MPDQLAVLVNRFDPVQGNGMRLSFLIDQFENTGAILWKPDFAKRHEDNFLLDPVVITDDEFAAAEFRVPADTMKKVLNGNHDGLPACKDFDVTGSVGGRGDVYPRQPESLNHPGVGNEMRTDALDAEDGFAPAQGGWQDQLIG